MNLITNACGIASSTESETKFTTQIYNVFMKCAPPYEDKYCRVLEDGITESILDKICQEVTDIHGKVVGYKSYDRTEGYSREWQRLYEDHRYIAYDENVQNNSIVNATTIIGDDKMHDYVITSIYCSTLPRH